MTPATSLILRAAIVALAALGLWYFSDGYRLAFSTLGSGGRWFNFLSALAVGVAAPLLALAAAGLAIANIRLGLAALLLGAALLMYWSHVIAFAIAVAIYGF